MRLPQTRSGEDLKSRTARMTEGVRAQIHRRLAAVLDALRFARDGSTAGFERGQATERVDVLL